MAQQIYKGKLRSKLDKYAWAFTFNNIDNVIPGFTGDTITDYVAESGVTPIIDGDNLKTDVSGWVAMVTFASGKMLVFSKGSDPSKVWDVNNGVQYTISGTI